VDMGSLYLGQDMGVRVWAGSIYVQIGYEDRGWLYLGQDGGVKI
jgi:hypothetical protein